MKNRNLTIHQNFALVDLLWGSTRERNEINVKYKTKEGGIGIWDMSAGSVNLYHNKVAGNKKITHIIIRRITKKNRLLRYLLRHKDILEKWLHNRGELHKTGTIGGSGANREVYRRIFDLDVRYGFIFNETPEGLDFWINVYENAKEE